jgi:hypothetical protein
MITLDSISQPQKKARVAQKLVVCTQIMNEVQLIGFHSRIFCFVFKTSMQLHVTGLLPAAVACWLLPTAVATAWRQRWYFCLRLFIIARTFQH